MLPDKVLTIRAKLLISMGLLSAILIVTFATAWMALNSSVAALNTVYVDRVQPLGDIKAVADAYAVSIVDNVHKMRAGTVGWSDGVAVASHCLCRAPRLRWRRDIRPARPRTLARSAPPT